MLRAETDCEQNDADAQTSISLFSSHTSRPRLRPQPPQTGQCTPRHAGCTRSRLALLNPQTRGSDPTYFLNATMSALPVIPPKSLQRAVQPLPMHPMGTFPPSGVAGTPRQEELYDAEAGTTRELPMRLRGGCCCDCIYDMLRCLFCCWLWEVSLLPHFHFH